MKTFTIEYTEKTTKKTMKVQAEDIVTAKMEFYKEITKNKTLDDFTILDIKTK